MARYEEVCNAMDLVGFEPSIQTSIFTALAAVLHLGNIQIHEDTNDYSYVLEPRSGPVKTVAVRMLWLSVRDQMQCVCVCLCVCAYVWLQDLLGVDIKHLIDALTVSVSYTRGEVVRRHWNKISAIGETLQDMYIYFFFNRLVIVELYETAVVQVCRNQSVSQCLYNNNNNNN